MGSISPERAAGGIDEEADVLGRILGVEEEELADDGVGDEVVDAAPEEDDPLLQQQPHHVRLRPPHRRRRSLGRRIERRDRGAGPKP